MPREVPVSDNAATVTFAGGLNSRQSADKIDPEECVAGSVNFSLDLDNGSMKSRAAFKLVGTVPNVMAVRGFAQHERSDGSHATLIQGGDTVYDWDGLSTFVDKGSVPATARLRGQRWHNWDLSPGYVIIADLAKAQPVSRYDGTTFEVLPTDFPTGDFFAKYCFVEDERVYFGNVRQVTDTPQIFNVSAIGDPTALSPPGTPTQGAATFFVTPDLKPVNGLLSAFQRKIISTAEGRLYQLTGSDVDNWLLDIMYPDSGADGDEAVSFIGNDVAYGKGGRLETAFATIQLGDVETDDLSRKIAPDIRQLTNWTVAYSTRFQKVYFFAENNPQCFVLHKAFIDERLRKITQQAEPPDVSPWSVYQTNHPMAFQPTAVMTMHDPLTNLENVYMGDSLGNFYVMEGGAGEDGGQFPIQVSRRSGIIQLPLRQDMYDIQGWIRYKKEFAADVTVTIEWGGRSLGDTAIPITLDEAAEAFYYNATGPDAAYYNDESYYASQFSGRLSREDFTGAGRGDQFQIRIDAFSQTGFEIAELGLRFQASDPT